jgi:hypothetical protein
VGGIWLLSTMQIGAPLGDISGMLLARPDREGRVCKDSKAIAVGGVAAVKDKESKGRNRNPQGF